LQPFSPNFISPKSRWATKPCRERANHFGSGSLAGRGG
jgi:hypothetical protein